VRAVLTRLGPALAIGTGAAWLIRGDMSLVDSTACPDLGQALMIAVARTWHGAPVGPIWTTTNLIALGVATVYLALLVRRLTQSWSVAASVAAAFAWLPIFAPRLAPLAPLPAALTAAAALLVCRPDARLTAASGIVLLALTIAAPPLLPVVFAVVGWLVVREQTTHARLGRGIAFLAIVTAGIVLVSNLTPALPPDAARPLGGCIAPWPPVVEAASAHDAVTAIVGAPSGLMAAALAVLGAFVWISNGQFEVRWSVVALLPLVLVGLGVRHETVLLPTLVGFWVLVARGLAEAVTACGQRPGGRLAATFLLLLLPGLHLATPPPRLDAERRPMGHSELSLDGMKRLLALVPQNAILVREDAATDVLLRAADGAWQRLGKMLHSIDPRSPSLAAMAAVPEVNLLVLPAAQAVLQNRGYRLEFIDPLAAYGLAAVRSIHLCEPVSVEWHRVADAPSFEVLALAASHPHARGPVVVYAAGERPFMVRPVDWPQTSLRGFSNAVFDRAFTDDTTHRRDYLGDDAAPLAEDLLEAPHLVRLELWRTPDAPLALAVGLGAAPSTVYVGFTTGGQDQDVGICPAFPLERRTLLDPATAPAAR
jgi:hypothetical protein